MNYLKVYLAVIGYSLIATSVAALETMGYQGSGNESAKANSYMTYTEISSSDLSFHLAKKRSFKVTYGSAIDVTSFSAVLNGKDISRRFYPAEGTTESVYLPLKKGENRFTLKISDYANESAGLVAEWDIDEFIITLKSMGTTPHFSLTAPPGLEDQPLPPRRNSTNNRP